MIYFSKIITTNRLRKYAWRIIRKIKYEPMINYAKFNKITNQWLHTQRWHFCYTYTLNLPTQSTDKTFTMQTRLSTFDFCLWRVLPDNTTHDRIRNIFGQQQRDKMATWESGQMCTWQKVLVTKNLYKIKIISRPHHVHRRVAELFSDLPKLYFSHSAASHFLKFPLAADYSRRDIRKNACSLLTTWHRSAHRLVLDLKLLGRLRLVHRRAGAHADAHVRFLSTWLIQLQTTFSDITCWCRIKIDW